jgi:aminoglycoside phosphotransferase family enzyme
MSLPFQPLRSGGAPSAAPTAEALRHALTRAVGPPVDVRESYASWVVIAEDRAYRLFKHVRLPAADLRSYEGRLRACEDVVTADRELGGTVVLGVRAVVPVGDSFAIADERHPDAADHVVAMRRFDDAATLAARAHDPVDRALARTVGERLAGFHHGAPTMQPADPLRDARGQWHALAESVKAMTPAALPPRRLSAIERFADAFVRARGRQFRHRADDGRVRDGHGDLRPSNILVGEEGMPIVGREAHDAGLRRVDAGDDLATLLAHLEQQDARAWADAIVAAYRDAGGNPGDDQLLSFWAARRALVAAARASSPGGPPSEASRAFAALAERLVWRARGPVAVVVCGRPPDGRGRLAAMVARRSGWPLLSGGQGAALERQVDVPDTNLVLEHPLSDPESQRIVIDLLRRSGRQPRVVECRGRESLHAAITPDVAARHRLIIDPEGDGEDLIDEIAGWLDAALRDLAPVR